MDYITYRKRSEYVLDLIAKGRLLSPKQLTDQFDCSERTVRRIIENLKLQGHTISYCKKTQRYTM